jgi:Ni,Fe-hydrogenase III large subunit/Ni,Fe-hydrogenase III component G
MIFARIKFTRLPGAMTAWHATVDARRWRECCAGMREAGGQLVALWGSDERPRGEGFAVHAALVGADGLLCLTLALSAEDPAFPDLSAVFPAANRMQRAAYDLLGIRPDRGEDRRRWLRHGAWPEDCFPLRKDFDGSQSFTNAGDDYEFVRVEGEGVHEIPVGPVHAGTIEPGHFRFSVVGEKVLRLEERLGYTHKGIEKRFESLSPAEGARLAGRVSGDSTVAFAWAYCMALEGIAGVNPPPRASWLRALALERERIANHLGDLGFLGNDAALGFGLAQFSRLREDWLRTNRELFGHRLLMDCVVTGGVAKDLDEGGAARIRGELDALESQVKTLRGIYDEHAGLQDRFLTTGRVSPQLAEQLGLTGIAGRASSQAWDLRAQFPCAPYDELDVAMATHRNGDVAARVAVRFDEVMESIRLLREILGRLPGGPAAAEIPDLPDRGFGIGWVEGWRGPVLVALASGPGNSIHRCHAHDPSWQNWPLLEHAVIGNIVPDFPLINKSFNLSYSGQDL